MRKFVSLSLVICIILSLLSIPAGALSSNFKFLVAESYNDQTTGMAPGNGAYASGAAKVVVTAEKKDKAVEMSASATDSSLYYETGVEAKVVSMFADIKYVENWSATEFFIRDASNKNFILAYINTKGEFYSGDARLSAVVPKNISSSVQITYNSKRKKISIYLNGKAIVLNRFVGEAAYEKPLSFGIKVKGSPDTNCFVDNFALFEGYDVVKSSHIPQRAFLEAKIADTGDSSTQSDAAVADDEFVGDSVFTYRTFDEEGVKEFEGVSQTPRTNKIVMDHSVFDGNKYVKIAKKEAEESFIGLGGNQTARRMVFEADFSTDGNTPSGKLVYTRDGEAASMFCTFLNVDASGNITTTSGINIGKIEPLKWTKVGILFNLNDLTMDIYINGEKKIDDIVFANKTITGIPTIRINCDKKVNTGTLLIDNVKVYEGKDFREITNVGPKSKKIPDSVPQGHLGMNKAISPYSHTYYTDKTKYEAEHKMILENEDKLCYVHEDELKKMFGAGAILASPHATEPGYYEALETAKANGYMITSEQTRLHIFSKTPVTLTEERIMEVYRYLFNVRHSAKELLELYKNSENYQKHPRIMIDQEKLDEIKALYATDPLMQEWGANVINEADMLMGEDDYTYPITGGSMDEVNYSMNDIINLCLAYHLTGNERYVGRTWRFIKNICDLGNWNPGGYLDVGELSYITAIGYDWLYHQWTPEQRKYIEERLLEKGTKLTRDLYLGVYDNTTYIGNDGKVTDFYVGWYDSENNWNPVCNGGTMCGAMALLDVYPEIASELIEYTLWALEYATPSYYPEGAWEEGGGYWNYALGYVVRVISSVRNVFGTDFRLLQTPGLDGTGWFGSKLSGSTGQYTIGDTSGGNPSTTYAFWLANEFNDPMLAAMRMQEFESMGKVGGYNEVLSYNPKLLQGDVEPPLDTFMDGMEVIALREAWYDVGATFVGASGGDSSRGHGHHDLGSFQIDMAGEKFICESGAENYNAKGGYFTSNRYRFYRSRAEGHNMYIINPRNDDLDYYGISRPSRAEGKLVESKPRGAIGTMDLTNVYREWVTHAERGYMLTDDRRTVVVRDEIDLKEPDSEIYYSLHTRAKIEKLNDTQIVLTLNGKKMLVSLLTNGKDVEFEEAEAKTISNVTPTVVKDTNNMSQGLRKFVIKMKGTGRVNITLKFKQYDDVMVSDYPEDINISEWTIPDGEVTPLPTLDGLYIDGKLVEGFDPRITGYSYLVASKETEAPKVTVDTDLEYEIIPTPTVEGDTMVKVYAKGSKDVYRAYRINFWKKPPLADIDGMRRYPIAKVTCIDTYEQASPPENTFDMDFGTRWASDSTLVPDQWIMFELDDVYPIEKIGIAWMSGTARVYKYRLEISTDGVNWTEVFNGESSGQNAKCEYLQLYGKMAKFVRYTGTGNSVNNWNSVTEVEILGNQR